ncbi:MAG: hypothetical protein DSO08_00420 [Candidatus Methanomethylicota archaeon]|uniref:Uncharacterized protein n=1 Tax=Thermoproteota archaeon TaxID=2056631 RepID=A0A523BI07_9CREN|nr:MAG: hypothetical protein DSO08_00420 [Candidatus Verstraetearchaeota archaeon]
MKGRYIMVGVFVVVALLLIGTGGYYYYTYYGTPRCEACGMIITPEMDANIKMIDLDTNQRVWTCCPGCMLRSVVAHPNVHIEALDSWYGTSAPKIVIEIRNGSVVSVTPDTARILLGSKVVKSCANNRIAINETSAALLLQYGWNRDNRWRSSRTSCLKARRCSPWRRHYRVSSRLASNTFRHQRPSSEA